MCVCVCVFRRFAAALFRPFIGSPHLVAFAFGRRSASDLTIVRCLIFACAQRILALEIVIALNTKYLCSQTEKERWCTQRAKAQPSEQTPANMRTHTHRRRRKNISLMCAFSTFSRLSLGKIFFVVPDSTVPVHAHEHKRAPKWREREHSHCGP